LKGKPRKQKQIWYMTF